MSCEKIAISARNLTKTYRLFNHPGDRIKQFFSLGLKRYYREFTALDDVSFDIGKGETVGIIGRNGSGKSTLLQLICGILKPTAGTIQVNGRVSALLELGAGFHPEFTGRENVYFQGAVMGLSRQEIDARFDDIAAFADIGEFMDQPVRTYSSGMFVRLAFAIATHVEPDILVIDEALAVGDMRFQKKSFDHLSRMLKHSGLTLILVSHELRQIQRMCRRAIYLDQGRCKLDADASVACQAYYETSFAPTAATLPDKAMPSTHVFVTQTDEAELISVALLDQDGRETHAIHPGDPLWISIRFRLNQPMKRLELVVGTQSSDLTYLSSASTAERGTWLDLDAGEHQIDYILPRFPLAPGPYFVRLNLRDENFRLFFVGEALHAFHVKPKSGDANKPARLLDLETHWRIDGKSWPEQHRSDP
ncbi:MAG: ABC transporter ATP-binding protein [Methylophilaceae bacterium]|nr:ABC transporter ATP-binding protein [Methylophilaceae bacterium]